jgi:tripartite ATP-independent transporter DctM subunit
MTVVTLLVFGLFLTLVVLGVRIAIALGATACLIILLYQQGTMGISSIFYSNIAKFPLLAIPFFILAGFVMERSGVSARLINLASLIVGPIPGGLAIVGVAVCVFFGGISGSGPADAAAIGAVLIPAMIAKGYDRNFAAGLIATAGSTAILIPPSIAFVVYGVITEVSVPALFAGGIFPGLVAGAALVVPAYFISRKHGWGGERWGTPRELWVALKRAFWGLMAPAVILGSMYGGICTPTEAAIVAVVYGILLGWIYRTISWLELYRCMLDAAITSGVVMFIVAFAGLFGWAADRVGAIDHVLKSMLSLSDNGVVMILIVNVVLFIAGMLLDAISIFYVFMPIFIPMMKHFGWDPLWFGVVMTYNLAIGMATPPVAVNLYVTTSLADTKLDQVAVAVIPFVLAMVVGLIVVIFWPWLSLAPPIWFGLYKLTP